MNTVAFITKRDGRRDSYNPEKITSAICKAMDFAEDKKGRDVALAEMLTAQVEDTLNHFCRKDNTDTLSVELVHDTVENALIASRRPLVAKEYIRYRHQRNLARKADTMEIFNSIVQAQANDVTRENANMNADTPAGMMMKFASEATKTYVDEVLLPDESRKAVKDNLLHIHDKDYYPTKSLTCIQHPLDMALKNGYTSGHASDRPAKRIESASATACITMETVQNEMHGGQAIPAFDFYLAPYVRMAFEEEAKKLRKVLLVTMVDSSVDNIIKQVLEKPIKDYIAADVEDISPVGDAFQNLVDKYWQICINETVRRVHQSMEAFVHNMNNIHSRGGNQVVFSSVNYGTDTSAEGRCIIREILNTTYEGVGNGETAIFPIQIWKKKRGVNYLPGDPNYDLYKFACKVTARRFFPNYLNLDASYNQDEAWKADDPRRFEHEVATMGCRTRVYENRFGPKTSIGRGNLSFSTINLPGIAIRTMLDSGRAFGQADEQTLDVFFSNLEEILNTAALQLHQRFEFQATALAKQFPMLMSGMWLGSEKLGPNDTVRPVLNQGTLGIGFIGLAECLIALLGKHHAEDEYAQKIGIEIITFMRDKVNGYCEQYQHNYSVLATPAEGLSGKFTKVDRKKYGTITGVTDKDYDTNSNHVPVYYHCTPEQKAKVEAPYHNLTRGGHIFYVEMNGDATHNPEAVMRVVDLMDKYDMGYGSINHNRTRCLDCGYETGQSGLSVCPRCGGTHIDLLQRITGYLVGTTDRWNSGKKAELHDRVVHE